jgi:hypothetical protein
MPPKSPAASRSEPTPAPRDRRLPLSEIQFLTPQAVPGCPHRARRLVSGETIPQSQTQCPQLFFDPELRLLSVGDHLIPVDGGTVDYFVRAKAAK